MNKIIISVGLLLILMLSVNLEGNARGISEFDIEGNVKGLKEGKLFLLIQRSEKIDTVSIALAKNERFVFRNIKLPIYPAFYLIVIQSEFVDNLELFLDQADDIKINGNIKTWPNVEVWGSKTHDDFAKAKLIRKKVMDEDFATKYPTRVAESGTILIFTQKGIQAVVDQIPKSPYIPAMIATWTYTKGKFSAPKELKKTFYEKLSDEQKNSYYGKILARQVGIKD